MKNTQSIKEGEDLNPLSCNKKGLTIQDLIKIQVHEIEVENKAFESEQVNSNISDILAKQKIKERSLK